MKNYIITEEQLNKIIEQIDNEEKDTKKSASLFSGLFGGDDSDSEDIEKETIELPNNDPIQKFFNSLK